MRNFIKRLRKEKNEKGSGIILVIVALSFLGIIAGALLTAVAYAYRLKLYDYNTKDNFHYVEQAMDEVYAGLGGRTTETMQAAYTRTVEEMVEFDTSLRAYKNIGDEEANKRFKDYFMNGIKNDAAFLNISTLEKLIQSYISNSSVKVVGDNMKVVYYDEAGDIVMSITPDGATGGDLGATLTDINIGKIVIQNLVLRRTANYQRSSASGTFTQTISTDVEISRPDFNVQFNTVSADNSVLYDYALIADSGIEVNKSAASPLLINGNIYGGADYYNKNYNQYGVTDEDAKADYARPHSESFGEITLDIVSSKTHSADGTFLFNARLADMLYGNQDGILTDAEYTANKEAIRMNKNLLYNGYNENSKYSGLYINGAKVSIMADTIVVPGSIAVMNGAILSVYNSNGNNVTTSDVWADNVVLGGYNYAVPIGDSKTKDVGSKATFLANMFIRDDLEVNSDNSAFKLIGGYYGYGNGTLTNINESSLVSLTRRNNDYVPTISTADVDPSDTVENNVNIYYYVDKSNSAVSRPHYNSSAIIINGENSELDLSETTTLYVAGQAYVELSAKHEDVLSQVSVNGGGEIVYASGSNDKQDVNKEVVTYDPSVQDYRTGESLSVKSNQLIYIPNGTGQYKDVEDASGNVIYQTITINPMLLTLGSDGKNMFDTFFGAFYEGTGSDKKLVVPCVSIVPAGSTRTYHYFDFDAIYEKDHKGYDRAESMAAAFATAYIEELNKSSSSVSVNFSPIKEYLDQDVTSDTLFSAGNILLPDDSASVYASGALTGITSTIASTSGLKKTHKLIVSKDAGITRPVTADGDAASGNTDTVTEAVQLSMDFAKHYNYVKFSLTDLAFNSEEADFVDDVVRAARYGESALSPLNRYFTMNNLFRVEPSNEAAADSVDHKLNLSSGYKVWITDKDVEIKASDCEDVDGKKVMRGIIFSKGDVIFGAGVDRFEGLIVAGDKIYIGNDVTAISASPEICKTIMTELRTEKDPDAEKVLRFFVGYKSDYDDMTVDELKALCEQRGIVVEGENPTKDAYVSALISYDNSGDNTVKKINTIDYSDVIKYSNWMKNSE